MGFTCGYPRMGRRMERAFETPLEGAERHAAYIGQFIQIADMKAMLDYEVAKIIIVAHERVKKTGHLRPGIVRRNHVGEQVAPLRMHARRGLSIGDNVVYTTQKMNYGRRARQCPEHIFEAARR